MELHEVCQRYFKAFDDKIRELGPDLMVLEALNLKDQDREGLEQFLQSITTTSSENLKNVQDINEALVLVSQYVNIALLFGCYLGENMKARFTAEERTLQ